MFTYNKDYTPRCYNCKEVLTGLWILQGVCANCVVNRKNETST